MKKNQFIKTVVILTVSILLVILISNFILDNTGKINQGNFRVNDVVIESGLEIIEKQEEKVDALSNMVLDITQTNKLEMLITKNVNIAKATIDNIDIDVPLKVGNIYIKQSGQDKVYNIDKDTIINIYPEEKLEQYYIELNINNENCINNVNVPSQTNVVKFDGTILDLINQDIKDLKFDISFNLNLYDESGSTNTCKVNLELPVENISTDGISIKRDDLTKYNFRLKK